MTDADLNALFAEKVAGWSKDYPTPFNTKGADDACRV